MPPCGEKSKFRSDQDLPEKAGFLVQTRLRIWLVIPLYEPMTETAAFPQAAPRRAEARGMPASGRGMVRLDGWPVLGGGSLLALEPESILEGSLAKDAHHLRAVLERGRQMSPQGGLVGWVGFDGTFCFGVFPKLKRMGHRRESEKAARLRVCSGPSLTFTPQMARSQFVELVRCAQEYIAAGDIYQVNLSYPWLAEWPGELEPMDFYDRLCVASPAPYSAYLDLAGTQIFSASPECFLSMKGGKILTRPIKGTRPRSREARSDASLRDELLASEKERAELVMITDLERNDLGQVCEFGSVRVTELLKLESFAQVHHLVSTVEGTLRKDVDHLDALMACFPGGSISGAPKKRALEIIRELEPHQREIYTGAIGCLGFNGESSFSIAIRTAWKRHGMIQFHTGAGIVADSIADHEYDETRHKAQGLLQAALGAEMMDEAIKKPAAQKAAGLRVTG